MTTAVKPSTDWLARAAATRNAAVVHAHGVEIPTDVMFPSGAGITVVVSGGREGETVAVSDGGAAVRHVRDSGLYIAEPDLSAIVRAARAMRLDFGAGEIGVRVAPDDLGWAITRVANASRDIAQIAIRAVRRRQARNFKAVVRQQLARIFPTGIVTGRARIAGASAKPYRFDYSVRFGAGRQLTLDLPHPDPTTVSTTVLRNLDLRRRNPPDLVQMIVWDDREPWSAEALAQLRLAEVKVVRGSALEGALQEVLGVDASSGG